MARHADPDPAPAHRDRPALLRQITELLAQAGPTQPTAVGISLPDGDVEFAIKPLDGRDVVAALAGFDAPATWDAFAVVAPATARPLVGGPHRKVVVGALAARDGFTTSALLDLDVPPPPVRDDDGHSEDGDIGDDGDGDGRLLDACRRVLGLATAPPAHGPEWWAAMHWLDAIVRAVVGADLDRPPQWAQLRRLDAGARYARRPWSSLRRACAAGRVRIPEISRAGARWMDDGMFSREALSAYPPITQLVADLRDLLPWSSYDAMLRTLCTRLERSQTTGSTTVVP